jgi:hypothetical protein
MARAVMVVKRLEVRVRVRIRMEISSGAGKSEAWSIFAEVL